MSYTPTENFKWFKVYVTRVSSDLTVITDYIDPYSADDGCRWDFLSVAKATVDCHSIDTPQPINLTAVVRAAEALCRMDLLDETKPKGAKLTNLCHALKENLHWLFFYYRALL